MARDYFKAGNRQVEGLGQQLQTGLVGPPLNRRGGHPEPEDAVGLADDPFVGRFRLQANSEGGGIALLSNQDHQRSRQASSVREAIRNFWMKMIARMTTSGEKSIPNPRIGSIR